MSVPPPPFRPRCEPLEPRDNPSLLLAESFDGPGTPALPAGWESWGVGAYATTRDVSAAGPQAVTNTASADALSRLWASDTFLADAVVRVQVRSGAPTPVELFARGRNLATPSASYLGAAIGPGGGSVTLVEVDGPVRRSLATVAVTEAVPAQWLTVTLAPADGTAAVRVRRGDTGAYLTPQGTWQATETNALSVATTAVPTAGQAGVGRQPGGAGTVAFDAFAVEWPEPAAGSVPVHVEVPGSFVDVPPGVTEAFDSAAPRPAGWAGWTNDGSAGFTAGPGRALSGATGFTARGGSQTAARAWATTPLPADGVAEAAVYAESLIPATVLVRGSNLAGDIPSYYGVSVVRGVEVTLGKVVDGVETRLGSVKSKSYVSGVWLRAAVAADGGRVRAVVRRADTGEYLTADGDWSDVPQPAVVAFDESIPGGGFAGVARPARFGGVVTVDDFDARATVPGGGIDLTVAASQPASAVRGEVTFTAVAAPAGAVRRVEFRLDGRVRSAGPTAPAEWTLDTTLLANGPHEVTARAVSGTGDVATTTVVFDVANADPVPPPARPVLPRHYSHIRLAALAYAGNPLGAFEQDRLRDSVDLVIPSPKYAAAIDAAAPATPQLVYSNISNLYQGLLTDWLDYAGRTGADREAAFYHVSKATPFTGGSPSSQPVTHFWGVTAGPVAGAAPTDLTAAARGGRTFGVAFAGPGTAVTIGHLDRFREVNVALDRPAAGGWAGVWEYVTADGWRPLPITIDGTAGFTRSGRVEFDPPTDWAAGKLTGDAGLYAVRVRTTAAGTCPVAKTLLGRDYVGAGGRTAGVIPAFDFAADADRDGYLSDAEYANRVAGKDARFVHETRLFYPYYGQMRFATDPSDVAVRRWAADHHARLLAANPLADGLFLDNSNGRLPVAGLPVLEPTANYAADFAALVTAIGRAVGSHLVVTNTAGGQSDADPVAAASGGVLEEFALRPTDATWAAVTDTLGLVARRLAADSPSPYVILDSHPGTFGIGTDRVKAGTLAYYYLAADPDKTLLMTGGGFTPSAPWQNAWIPSVRVDVGRPTGAAAVWATGLDPANAALMYKVFRREYANAVVLFKPRSYTLGQGTGTTADGTATTHQLGGNFRVLNPDATLGPVVTQVTLRNGEGVTLMRA